MGSLQSFFPALVVVLPLVSPAPEALGWAERLTANILDRTSPPPPAGQLA